jgi:tRNA1Val (adenine37-N6)-methyltransferase
METTDQRRSKAEQIFHFKQFSLNQDRCALKIGTDGILLGAWAVVEGAKTALDIGTGTGLIATMLAQRSADLQIDAVEIDPEASQQAAENMAASPWGGRLRVFTQSIQDFARESTQQYDLIVSNPPFFSGGTLSYSQDQNSVRHTIKLPHNEMLAAVRSLLTSNGKFAVVLPYMEGLRLVELAKNMQLYCTAQCEVRTKPNKPVERLLLQFERTNKPLVKTNLAVQGEGHNEWTEEFRDLTGMFYL